MTKLQENRKKWLDYLREPGRQKTRSKLEDYANNEARCCLGHACKVLGAVRDDWGTHIVYDDLSGSCLQECNEN